MRDQEMKSVDGEGVAVADRPRMPLWKRVLLGLFFGVVALVTTLAFVWVVYNAHARSQWVKLKEEMEKRGEKLWLSDLRPAAVPDAENFAMTPLLAPIFEYKPGVNSPMGVGTRSRVIVEKELLSITPKNKSKEPKKRSWRAAEAVDLVAWQQLYLKAEADEDMDEEKPVGAAGHEQDAARAVLKCLSKDAAAMEELKKAAELPYAVFPVHYDEPPFRILLPHLAVGRRIGHYATLSAVARLRLDQTQEALSDLKVAWRFCDAIESEPILISYLVRIAMVQEWMQAVWEGARDRRWTAAQLAFIQERVQKEDWVNGGLKAVGGERAMMNSAYALWMGKRDLLKEDLTGATGDAGGDTHMAFAAQFMPEGVLIHNQIAHNQAMNVYVDWLAELNPSAGVYRDLDVKELEDRLVPVLNPRSAHNFLVAQLIPAFANVMSKMKLAQAERDVALVGIALERYALDHGGQYPEQLNALIPGYLKVVPLDVFSGKSLMYERVGGEGRVLVYSVGANGVNDQGRRVVRSSGSKEGSGPDDPAWTYKALMP